LQAKIVPSIDHLLGTADIQVSLLFLEYQMVFLNRLLHNPFSVPSLEQYASELSMLKWLACKVLYLINMNGTRFFELHGGRLGSKNNFMTFASKTNSYVIRNMLVLIEFFHLLYTDSY
jgi:hypothetical protein